MSGNTFGKQFKVTSFGESHGAAVGCIIDGCPPNLELTAEYIQQFLDLRRPGSSQMVSQRREPDRVKILSGVFSGKTLGTPLALQIDNVDAKEKDYSELRDKFRPGHGDLVYQQKYGIRDYRGGGRASARETAARVAAGAVARKVLSEQFGIEFLAYVKQIGNICADIPKGEGYINEHSQITRMQVYSNPCYFPDTAKLTQIDNLFTELRRAGDSVGSLVELIISNVPAGLGEPVFDKLDALLAQAMMSINAAKAVEIGAGFACVTAKGSEFRDEIYAGNGEVDVPKAFSVATRRPANVSSGAYTKYVSSEQSRQQRRSWKGEGYSFGSNNAGGILAGISTGQDIVVKIGFKPPASIRIPANTVDSANNPTQIQVTGRHDVCVGIRAVPIVEAMGALVILDCIMQHRGQNGFF